MHTQGRLWSLPSFFAIPRSPVHLFLASLVLGVVGLSIVLAPILRQTQRLAPAPAAATPRPVATGAVATGTVATGAVATGAVATGAVATGAVATGAVATAAATAMARLLPPPSGDGLAWRVWSCLVYIVAAGLVVGVISPWMRLFLRTDPFLWTFAFVAEGWRLPLALYWAGLIAGSVALMALRDRWRTGAARGDGSWLLRHVADALASLPLILLRKYFHLLAVVMFSPGLLYEVHTHTRTHTHSSGIARVYVHANLAWMPVCVVTAAVTQLHPIHMCATHTYPIL
jgi:hypothetical protein